MLQWRPPHKSQHPTWLQPALWWSSSLMLTLCLRIWTSAFPWWPRIACTISRIAVLRILLWRTSLIILWVSIWKVRTCFSFAKWKARSACLPMECRWDWDWKWRGLWSFIILSLEHIIADRKRASIHFPSLTRFLKSSLWLRLCCHHYWALC